MLSRFLAYSLCMATTTTTTTAKFECSNVVIKDNTKQDLTILTSARLSSIGDEASLTFFLGSKCVCMRVSKKEANRFLGSCKEEGLTLIMD